MTRYIIGISAVWTSNYTASTDIIWIPSLCTCTLGHTRPCIIVSIFKRVELTLSCYQKTCKIRCLPPTALGANFDALTSINLQSIKSHWRSCTLCASRDTMPWTQEITVVSSWTEFIAIWLGWVSNSVTKPLREGANVSAEIPACWVVLEVFYGCVWKAIRCAFVDDRVSPVVGSNALLNAFITLSEQGNDCCVRTVHDTFHISVIFEHSVGTCTVAFTVCWSWIDIWFLRRTYCNTFLVPGIIVQRAWDISQHYGCATGRRTDS